MIGYKKHRIDDIAELIRDPVEIGLAETYTEIGVRSFGRGIFHKEPLTGADLGSKKVYWIRPGELVFNTVFAWEGAVAVSGEAERGKIGSHRFMTYEVDDQIADVRYLCYYFSSEHGRATLAAASPGSAGRNRTLGIKAFAAKTIELPSIDHQRRIVAKLDAALSSLDRIGVLDRIARISSVAAATECQLVDGLVEDGWAERRLDSIADINPRPSRLVSSENVLFVPMAAVDDKSGAITGAEYRLAGSVKSGYTQFQSGDVIFARITPCMQNGKSAIVPGDNEYGYGSTEFHVIRTRGDVSSEWIHFWVRRIKFREEAAYAFSGTAGQQRVPADFLRSSRVLVPPNKEPEGSALRRAWRLSTQKQRLERNVVRSADLRNALCLALLNAAFSGQL